MQSQKLSERKNLEEIVYIPFENILYKFEIKKMEYDEQRNIFESKIIKYVVTNYGPYFAIWEDMGKEYKLIKKIPGKYFPPSIKKELREFRYSEKTKFKFIVVKYNRKWYICHNLEKVVFNGVFIGYKAIPLNKNKEFAKFWEDKSYILKTGIFRKIKPVGLIWATDVWEMNENNPTKLTGFMLEHLD